MPIYEYECEECGRRSSYLILKAEGFTPTCKVCGSTKLTKLISRVIFFRSEEERLERLADPSRFGDLDENDPRSIARWMKKMGKELGEDMGEDFDQMVDEAMEAEENKEGDDQLESL